MLVKDEQIGEERINATAASQSLLFTGEDLKVIMRHKDALIQEKQKH